MNIYIRKPSQGGTRRPLQLYHFPVARYNRQRFRMHYYICLSFYKIMSSF